MSDSKPATALVHAGEPNVLGAVSMPVFHSANFVDAEGLDYHDIRYIRLGNVPNQVALSDKLAAVCGGDAAVVLGSGMAAISTTLLSLLSAGDRLLVQPCLYGGTLGLLAEDLPRFGVAVEELAADPAHWPAQVTATTRAVLTESITNPLLEVIDHAAVVAFAREHALISMVDNTTASPINFRPLNLGYDLELQSATKYLGGHSDLVAGAVIGRADLVAGVKKMLGHLGGALDPNACFLLGRGMKTMALRVQRQNANALHIAGFLAGHDKVTRVHYPGLADHPHRELAERFFDGCGGLLAFEIDGDGAAASRFVGGVRLFKHAPSFGGVESLVTRPCESSHAGVPRNQRLALGITDSLVRVAIGIEDADDLVADLSGALAQV